MNKLLSNKIYDDFSYMFEEKISLDVLNGWHDLIYELLTIIKALDSQQKIRINTIKQKYGTLRLYHYYSQNALINNKITSIVSSKFSPENIIHKVITLYEFYSKYICEICGDNGSLDNTGGYIMCVCLRHANMRREDPESLWKEDISLDVTNVEKKSS